MTPENILPTYQRVALEWARERDCSSLFEKRWLDRMIRAAPGKTVLDLGCGSGRPVAAYLVKRRRQVTGVDGAPAMVDLFRANLPGTEAIEADMRGLALGRSFDAILAWNSFFHLSPDDQRAMFPVFAAHAKRRTALMFTSGPGAGEVTGEVAGHPVYHSSLWPHEYEALLNANGFEVLYFMPEDPDCRGHTIWLARFTGTPA